VVFQPFARAWASDFSIQARRRDESWQSYGEKWSRRLEGPPLRPPGFGRQRDAGRQGGLVVVYALLVEQAQDVDALSSAASVAVESDLVYEISGVVGEQGKDAV